jgi:hypothetical protein
MSKTHYLGRTKSGFPILRASAADYGYRFAAVRMRNGKPTRSIPNMSTTPDGAATNFNSYHSDGFGASPLDEIVEISVVDGKTFRAAKAEQKGAGK